MAKAAKPDKDSKRRPALVDAANEINEVLNLEPKIDVSLTNAEIEESIRDVIAAEGENAIDPDKDHFTEDTTKVLMALGWDPSVKPEDDEGEGDTGEEGEEGEEGQEGDEDGEPAEAKTKAKPAKAKVAKEPKEPKERGRPGTPTNFLISLLAQGGDVKEIRDKVNPLTEKAGTRPFTVGRIHRIMKNRTKRGGYTNVIRDDGFVQLTRLEQAAE
jgi:hypothetical protein